MNTPSKEDLDNLFGLMFEDYFEKASSDTTINSAAQPTHGQEDSPSTSSIIVNTHEAPLVVTTSDEQTSSISLQESDEFNHEDSADFDGNTHFVPYDSLNHEEIESSTTNLEPSNVQNFHQVQHSTHIWTKDHPLDQVISDPSKPVMTRQRLHTDSEVCMYALTVTTIEPKNIKEAMADHSWIESIQDELNQFERLQVWKRIFKKRNEKKAKNKQIQARNGKDKCMRIRSQARRLRQQQRHQQQVPPNLPNLVELPIVTMADDRTMAELLQAPTEGYEDAIVVPEIEAANFEIKHGLLTLVQNKHSRHDKEDPQPTICYFKNHLYMEIS
ncbi:hypothetical protein Tco_1377215 [Tanacetum coccineum]